MPYPGSWVDQPLWIINQLDAMDFVYNMVLGMKKDGADFTDLSAEEAAMIAWLNKVR